MRSDSYATSVHEAGHALTAYLCGGEAWIDRKGHCGARIPDDAASEDRWVIAHLLIDASGLAGESLLCPYDETALAAAADDREEFAAGCKALRGMGSPFITSDDDLTWQWYVQAAKALLACHDRVLADLANQVEHQGSLDRGTVERRIAWWGIRPIFTDTEWKFTLVDLLEDSLEALESSVEAKALARRVVHTKEVLTWTRK